MDQDQQTSRHLKSSQTSETSHWTLSSLDSVPLQSSSRLQTLIMTLMFLFQKWLGSRFPEDVGAWWLLMNWLQLQFTLCEALPSVWIGFAWQYSQACGHPCCLCTFSYPISSFQSTLHLLWYSTPWTSNPFSNGPLWLTLFVKGVNDSLLDHCQVLWDTDFWLSLAVSSNHQNLL